MRIQELAIKNFRGISDLKLAFNPDINTIVLIGINGVGKTSILDCLSILLSKFIFDITQPQTLEEMLLLSHEKPILQKLTFTDSDQKDHNQQIQVQIKFDWENYQDIIFSIPLSNINNQKPLVREINEKLKAKEKTSIPLAIYYNVNRNQLDISLELLDNISDKIDAYKQALTEKQISFKSFFQWFRTVEDLENEQFRDNNNYVDQNLEAVRSSIYMLLGKDTFKDLRIRRQPLRMTIKKDNNELIINQLSDGEKALFALVGDLTRRLAIAHPNLTNPCEGKAVVLIDEIEQHLHPKWQREIIPSLTKTFPNCQFIITTHSPQVISHVPPEGVYILAKENEEIVVKHPSSSFGRDSNRILEDVMEVPARPAKIKQDLLELFRLIEKGELDQAKKLQQSLITEIGDDEPEFVKANILIRSKEILGKK